MTRLRWLLLAGFLAWLYVAVMPVYHYWFSVETIEVPHGQREEHR